MTGSEQILTMLMRDMSYGMTRRMHALLAERAGLKSELEKLEGEMEKYLKELGYV